MIDKVITLSDTLVFDKVDLTKKIACLYNLRHANTMRSPQSHNLSV